MPPLTPLTLDLPGILLLLSSPPLSPQGPVSPHLCVLSLFHPLSASLLPHLLPCNTTCVTFLHCRFSILRFLGSVIFLFINLWWLSSHSEEKLKSLQCPSGACPCCTPTIVNPRTVSFSCLFTPFSQVKPGPVSGLLHLVPFYHIFDAPLPSSISSPDTIIPWLHLSPPN